MNIKVFLVEDYAIVRLGIKEIFEKNNGTEVVGEAFNGEDALQKIAVLKPDIVLMDINMPVMNGIECTRRLKKEYPEIKVLALSMYDHETYLIDMIEAGAEGYVLKNTRPDELLFAVSKIMNNGIYIGPEFIMNIISKKNSGKGTNTGISRNDFKITDKEMDVLNLMAQGCTNIEMSQKLFTSVRTIETRRKSLLEKTSTSNTATLIRFAVVNGLIK